MLKLHVKRLGNVAVLFLQGRIVNGDTEVLRNTVQAISEVGAVKLDLARVTTVDAHGLGVMLELREQLAANGVQFELTNVSALVKRVFEITRLDTVFQITRSVDFTPAIANVMRPMQPMLAA
jgi:anti-sigma B factor antagonist